MITHTPLSQLPHRCCQLLVDSVVPNTHLNRTILLHISEFVETIPTGVEVWSRNDCTSSSNRSEVFSVCSL